MTANQKSYAAQKARWLTDPEYRERKRAANQKGYRKRAASGHHRRKKREYFQNNIQARIAKNLRNRLRGCVRKVRGYKIARTEILLGCSYEDFLNFIERLFAPGMSWDNYGQWHLDHRKPCASFDLTKPEQQSECFHFSNIQPLWRADNFAKGDSV